MNADHVHEAAAGLLAKASLPPATEIHAMQGGRNNKVFRVGTPAGPFLLKSYFHHPDDPRDRLAQEFAFLEHLARKGSRFAARPLAADPANHFGLMEFLDGVRPEIGEVDPRHIVEAIAFFLDANTEVSDEERPRIPAASESCFSISEHVAGTRRRVARLDQMLNEDDVDREAIEFVRADLMPFWNALDASVISSAGKTVDDVLPTPDRRLSPSDFGFHNSLRQSDGRLKFLDFEYAGWDDPAKLVIDFANQPDMLLPTNLERLFREAVIGDSPDPEKLRRRVTLLEPVYQTKWACICLNDFLAFGRNRHRFTDGEKADNRARRIFQLSRARTMMSRARESFLLR